MTGRRAAALGRHGRSMIVTFGTAAALTALVAAHAGPDPASLPTGTTLVQGIPVLEESFARPGSRLADGFTVADGTVLLGTVFPHQRYDTGERGWSAVLLLTGEANEVPGAYVDQAATAGLPLVSGGEKPSCFLQHSVWSCRATARAAFGDAYRSLIVHTQQAPQRGSRPPLAHVLLRYDQGGDDPLPALQAVGRPDVAVAAPASPSRQWPPLPSSGAQFEFGYGGFLTVVPGSALVAPPADESLGGWISVVRLDAGRPAETIDAYARQGLGSGRFLSTEPFDRDGATVLSASWNVDGGEVRATAVSKPGRPAYLLLSHVPFD